MGYGPITEFRLTDGRRIDIMADSFVAIIELEAPERRLNSTRRRHQLQPFYPDGQRTATTDDLSPALAMSRTIFRGRMLNLY